MSELQIGDKVRMLENNENFWNKGDVGTVVLQDTDGHFWVAFGDDQRILRSDTNWLEIEEDDDTCCVGSVQTDTLETLEVIS